MALCYGSPRKLLQLHNHQTQPPYNSHQNQEINTGSLSPSNSQTPFKFCLLFQYCLLQWNSLGSCVAFGCLVSSLTAWYSFSGCLYSWHLCPWYFWTSQASYLVEYPWIWTRLMLCICGRNVTQVVVCPHCLLPFAPLLTLNPRDEGRICRFLPYKLLLPTVQLINTKFCGEVLWDYVKVPFLLKLSISLFLSVWVSYFTHLVLLYCYSLWCADCPRFGPSSWLLCSFDMSLLFFGSF